MAARRAVTSISASMSRCDAGARPATNPGFPKDRDARVAILSAILPARWRAPRPARRPKFCVCAAVMVNGTQMMRLVGTVGGLFLLIGACNSDAAPTGGDASQASDTAPPDGDAGQISSASYAICSTEAATTLYRVDREAMTCTFVVLTPSTPSCPSGDMISNLCFASAGISKDVAACDTLQIPSSAVTATSVSGTFTTHVEDPAGPGGIAIDLAEFDLALTFPPISADLPTTQHLVGTRCVVACVRPVSSCGS